MKKIESLSATIEESIINWNLPETPSNLYSPLRYFMQIGGKRMRPVLTLMAAELFGEPSESAISAAFAVELFHNFTLIHDDIMDAAPIRRSMQTIHTKWNENIAILSGDVLMVKAYQEICKQKPEDLPKLLPLFNKTAIEVCEGQQMDMDFESRNDVSIAEYIEMIRLKTSVLLGCALELGAIVAQASNEDCKRIYQFGQELGLAFQIKDDILDLYGDPEKFGKQIGGDVIANKKTLLYLLALEKADDSQKTMLKSLENESNLESKIESVKEIFNSLFIRELAEQTMQKHYEIAISALNEINIAEERKTDLRNLATYLMHREN